MDQSAPDDQRLNELAEQLEQLGFYRYTQPRHIPQLKAMVATTGCLTDERIKRDYPADAESLAECGVGELLRDIAPILKAQSFDLDQIEETCSSESYSITVNATEVVLYSAAEMAADIASKGMTTNIWELAARRTCALLNKLLIEHGSNERVYSFSGGNDHWVFFLTEALYQVLCDSGAVAVLDLVRDLQFYGPSELLQDE